MTECNGLTIQELTHDELFGGPEPPPVTLDFHSGQPVQEETETVTTKPALHWPQLPCTIQVFRDGNMIGALIGENLHEGVAGFGETFPEAIQDLLENLQK